MYLKGAEAEALNRGEDIVGRLGPAKRLGIGVGGADVGRDGSLEVGDGSERAEASLSSASRPNESDIL